MHNFNPMTEILFPKPSLHNNRIFISFAEIFEFLHFHYFIICIKSHMQAKIRESSYARVENVVNTEGSLILNITIMVYSDMNNFLFVE